jgi:hypothetical protein
MANMSYCRFENTYGDLRDCYNNIHDDDLSETEERYKARLIELCKRIVEEAGEPADDDDDDFYFDDDAA